MSPQDRSSTASDGPQEPRHVYLLRCNDVLSTEGAGMCEAEVDQCKGHLSSSPHRRLVPSSTVPSIVLAVDVHGGRSGTVLKYNFEVLCSSISILCYVILFPLHFIGKYFTALHLFYNIAH